MFLQVLAGEEKASGASSSLVPNVMCVHTDPRAPRCPWTDMSHGLLKTPSGYCALACGAKNKFIGSSVTGGLSLFQKVQESRLQGTGLSAGVAQEDTEPPLPPPTC